MILYLGPLLQCSLKNTAGADSVVSLTPRIHRGGIHENDYWPPFPLKGNHSKKKYISKHHIHMMPIQLATLQLATLQLVTFQLATLTTRHPYNSPPLQLATLTTRHPDNSSLWSVCLDHSLYFNYFLLPCLTLYSSPDFSL
jgi:hypothetical protein